MSFFLRKETEVVKIYINRRSEHDQMRTMLAQLSSTTTDARVFYSIATVS